MGKYGLEDVPAKGILEIPVVVPIVVEGLVVETSTSCEAKEVGIVELIWFAQGYYLNCMSTRPYGSISRELKFWKGHSSMTSILGESRCLGRFFLGITPPKNGF